MITAIARMFQVHLAPQRRPNRHASIKDLANIRHQLQRSIVDCTSDSSYRLRKKIDQARTPQELWLLRNDAYQVISQQHNQTVAVQRINGLIPSFEGWLEPKQLVRIG
ncbi:hypothetical protein [Hydrogenophaga sp.]|uniref:hypothetical protein n=1 Tax=Hydrogenophaga sp. TaxID=1904254 RepID=UPI003D14B935